jgi:hypothetical protein
MCRQENKRNETMALCIIGPLSPPSHLFTQKNTLRYKLEWREVMLSSFCKGDLFCFLLTKQHRDAIY